MDTLVLSHNFLPLTRISWHRAFNMVMTGRAEVLEEYEDRIISSYSAHWPMPSVIRFVRAAVGYFKRGVRFNRKNIWLRDRGKCQYCGLQVSLREFTFDHVTPQSQGGKTNWKNIVVACMPCNQRKRNRTPQQAGMRLLNTPVRPKSLPTTDLSTMWGGDMPETWRDYLGTVNYWHGSLR